EIQAQEDAHKPKMRRTSSAEKMLSRYSITQPTKSALPIESKPGSVMKEIEIQTEQTTINQKDVESQTEELYVAYDIIKPSSPRQTNRIIVNLEESKDQHIHVKLSFVSHQRIYTEHDEIESTFSEVDTESTYSTASEDKTPELKEEEIEAVSDKQMTVELLEKGEPEKQRTIELLEKGEPKLQILTLRDKETSGDL